jgi:VanZ family protein
MPNASPRILMLAIAALAMAGIMIWGAMQPDDPLSPWIHTDKMRHVVAFACLGLCAGLMPTPRWRLIGLAVVLAFALAVEAIQIPVPDRNADIYDLAASAIGAFAGFGIGAAIVWLWEELRAKLSRQAKRSPQDL